MKGDIKARAAKKIKIRQAILKAATYEFKNHGFRKTAVSRIMSRAKLGVGTFYNYFDSKEEVLMNIVKDLFAQVEVANQNRGSEKVSSIELLKFCCEATAKIVDENRFVLPLLASAVEYSDKPEQIPKNLSPGFRTIFDEIIQRGQESGEIRKDIPFDLISEMLHSIYQAAAFSKLEIPFQENIKLKIKILLDGIKEGQGTRD